MGARLNRGSGGEDDGIRTEGPEGPAGRANRAETRTV